MDVQTLTYSKTAGWNIYPLPELDSVDTLVMTFGSSSFADYPWPLDDLREAYPTARHMGFATPSEDLGERGTDGVLKVAVMRLATSNRDAVNADKRSSRVPSAAVEFEAEAELA